MTSAQSDPASAEQRIVQHFPPGASTSTPMNLDYRIGKLVAAGLLKGRWLDYGSAEGDYTFALVAKGADTAVGFDVIEARVCAAREKFRSDPRVTFHFDASGAVPEPDQSFDGVFINEVMEHVTDEGATLTEVNRLLRPGGHIVVISPNRWFPFECHGAMVGERKLDFPVPFLPWLPESIGQRYMLARNYWPSELGDLVARYGFEIEPLQFVWPVLEAYPWMPSGMIGPYQRLVPKLDRMPLIGRFGVSTLVIGRKVRDAGGKSSRTS